MKIFVLSIGVEGFGDNFSSTISALEPVVNQHLWYIRTSGINGITGINILRVNLHQK